MKYLEEHPEAPMLIVASIIIVLLIIAIVLIWAVLVPQPGLILLFWGSYVI